MVEMFGMLLLRSEIMQGFSLSPSYLQLYWSYQHYNTEKKRKKSIWKRECKIVFTDDMIICRDNLIKPKKMLLELISKSSEVVIHKTNMEKLIVFLCTCNKHSKIES